MSRIVEEWRPVVGYEGLYEVSDWGNVRSLNYNKTKQVRELKNTVNLEGYCVVTIKGRQKKVHRLVAEAFIPNPEDKKEVGHLKTLDNGLEDKTANEVWNLAWMTREENANYGTIGERLSESKKGENNPMKRPEVATKVAEKQRENGKKQFMENPEAFFERMSRNRSKGDEKRKIKINQYNKDTGEFIKTWDSAADVERELGIFQQNVRACCKGRTNSAGGFKWKYYDYQ